MSKESAAVLDDVQHIGREVTKMLKDFAKKHPGLYITDFNIDYVERQSMGIREEAQYRVRAVQPRLSNY